MSRGTKIDLTGRWTGFFNYPVVQPPVNFEASLQDSGGRLTGRTNEPAAGSRTVHAVIDGYRDGFSVRFVKMYDEADGHYDIVHYSGTLAADGNEIEGRWDVPGSWSGTFLMIRAGGAEEEFERVVAEPVGPAS